LWKKESVLCYTFVNKKFVHELDNRKILIMIKNKPNLITLIILLIVSAIVKTTAQEAVPATGGEATGNGGTVSYTIGQVAYVINAGVSNSETQGVQQPYEISIITVLEQTVDDIDLSVFPNPTADFLMLKQEGIFSKNLSYELCDVQGRLLKSGSLANEETSIKMTDLPASTYFLSVKSDQKNIKSFKILKQ